MQVAFLYNAQDHHVPHSLPIACALSERPGFAVAALARAEERMALIDRLSRLYPDNRLTFEMMRRPSVGGREGASRLAKFGTLIANRRRLNAFDALVVPERTSLLLRRFGVTRPRFVHSFHGPSGHDRADDPRLAAFDLLLAPSARRLDRIAASGGTRPGRAAVIGSAKLDLVRRLGGTLPRLFANGRPTVLYNPHHWADKSSWHVVGRRVLEYFRASTRYNLIFAPHVRLFDPPARHVAEFAEYQGVEHLLIDLGSERSVDMSYSLAADIYLGDVSSQAFEFAVRPRPCIFLNPRGLAWAGDEDFASWRMGPVVDGPEELDAALSSIDRWRHRYEAAQREIAAANFPELDIPAPELGARAIAAFLRDGELRPGWDAAGGSLATRASDMGS